MIDIKKKVVFFLEGSFHLRFLMPLIKKVIDDNYIDYQIISIENFNIPNVKNSNFKFIEKKNINKFLLELEADYFITTTPAVGYSYFPKSRVLPKKNRPKYIYVFHSLVSPNQVYAKNSFNKFDIILSPNSIISEQLKVLVSKKTKILTTGYPLFLNKFQNENYDRLNKNILIAPSWGEKNFLTNDNFMNKLISFLKDEKANIFVRPHPMLKNLVNSSSFKIDESVNPDFHSYDCLFTDWSGIALEFYFLKRQKVFFVDSPKKIRRKITKEERNYELIENKIRIEIGEIIKFDQNLNVSVDINNLRIDQSPYVEDLYQPLFNLKKFYDYIDE
jgi:YidC/Oxa1 family membrane protein insertase